MCEGKRHCGGQGEEEGVKVLGEIGASALGVALEQPVALGGLESGKQQNHQMFFQAEGLENARGSCGNGFTLINLESSVPPFRGGAGLELENQPLPLMHIRPCPTHVLTGDLRTLINSQALSGFRITWGGRGEGL